MSDAIYILKICLLNKYGFLPVRSKQNLKHEMNKTVIIGLEGFIKRIIKRLKIKYFLMPVKKRKKSD